ncbi:MAG: integrase core domain-containing protein [Chloroflexota bacterium]|nr:integrase core domain-containing protein [Chloroflexota bacterium]
MKYEEVYLKAYQNVPEARMGIGAYMRFYSEERPHQALGYRTPREVFEAGSVSTRAKDLEDQVVYQFETML